MIWKLARWIQRKVDYLACGPLTRIWADMVMRAAEGKPLVELTNEEYADALLEQLRYPPRR